MSDTDVKRTALRGRPLLLWLGAAAVLAVALYWWGRGNPASRPNVLIITIDTFRADHLNREDTPALLDLADRGVRFMRARTPVPLTLPAHATLLSGVLPARHGIRDNTAPRLPDRAARGYALLAESFADAGYDTAAFVAASVLDKRYGLDAGFHEYHQPGGTRAGAPSFSWFRAATQLRRFRQWFNARPTDRPFFAWVHLWDPHAPYRPHPGDPRRPYATEAHQPAAQRYRGEVRRVDAAVERLLARIDADTTIVVVTADHGESLGEHGEDTHGYVAYGATMDVPLLLAGPGIEHGARGDPVSLEDVAPTLRRLADLPEQASDGFDLLESKGGAGAGRVVCGESLYANRLYAWAQQSVATDGRFSLVDGGRRLELFDCRADPGETAPLANLEEHAAFERLDRALRRYRAMVPGRAGAANEAGSDIGLAGSPSPYGSIRRAQSEFLKAAQNRTLRDVPGGFADIKLLARMDGAIAARAAALVEGLLPAVMELRRRDRTNPAPCLAQGRALCLVLRRRREAVEALREAIRRGYDSPPVRKLLEACR